MDNVTTFILNAIIQNNSTKGVIFLITGLSKTRKGRNTTNDRGPPENVERSRPQ